MPKGLLNFAAVAGPSAALGQNESISLTARRQALAAGQLIVAYGTSFLGTLDKELLAVLDERLSLALEPHLHSRASQLVDIAANVLQQTFAPDPADRVVVVIKRRGQA